MISCLAGKVGLKGFLSRLGFLENPFQFTNADGEEHLQSYFQKNLLNKSRWKRLLLALHRLVLQLAATAPNQRRYMLTSSVLESSACYSD
jgi:hypothetical protein